MMPCADEQAWELEKHFWASGTQIWTNWGASLPDEDVKLLILPPAALKDPGVLHNAAQALKISGELLIPLEKRDVNMRGLTQKFADAGFAAPEWFAVLPGMKDPVFTVRLTDRKAVELLAGLVVQRAGASWQRQAGGRLLKLLTRFGLEQSWLSKKILGSFWLRAVRQNVSQQTSALERLAARDFGSASPAALQFLVHAGHDALTLIAVDTQKQEPAGICRAARAADDLGLEREYAMLEWIHRHAPEDFLKTVPRALGLHRHRGRLVLNQSYLTGTVCRPQEGQPAALQNYFSTVRGWLVKLAKIPVPENAAPGNRFREALEAFQRLSPAVPRASGRSQDSSVPGRAWAVSADRSRRQELFWQAVREAAYKPETLPRVLTHRDLAPSNLLFDHGQLRVIDWGNSHWGLPMTDWARFGCNALLMAHRPIKLETVLQKVLAGKSPAGLIFFEQSRLYAEEMGLNAEHARALFFLGLLDYLASCHQGSDAHWPETYLFLWKDPQWLWTIFE